MPVADSLLTALTQYLLATSSVTSLLSTSTAIFYEIADTRSDLPFLIVEGYAETLPGESTEDQPIGARICAYADTVPGVEAIVKAVRNAVDTLTINPNSIRVVQFVWTEGQTTGVMRNDTRIHRSPLLWKDGVFAYEGSIDYVFMANTNI